MLRLPQEDVQMDGFFAVRLEAADAVHRDINAAK